MKGMIVAAQPEAVEVGAMVLRRGGNAMDAAIACAFTQAVVDPQMAGIAGYGTLQVFMPGKDVHENIEFYARSPLATREDMWVDILTGESRDGFVFLLKEHVNEIGYQAPGTPASLRGFATALVRHGTMELADVMAPAISYARNGFMVRPYVSYYWDLDQSGMGRVTLKDQLSFSSSGRQTYFLPNGRLKKPGDIVTNPVLATTLERIARQGPEIFYTGEIAEEIVADFAANGGLMTMEDLAGVQAEITAPIWGDYRGLRVASLAPPGGGVTLIEALQILARFDLDGIEHNSVDHIRLLAEILKRVTMDKDSYVGDPRFVDVPIERLLSKDHAEEHAADIRSGRKAHVTRLDQPKESQDTTHVTVIDSEGNTVTMTHTLGVPSGAVTGSLGVMYNGIMSGFDPRPGRPGSLAPGKARTSSQMPTIVFNRNRPCIALGAPGGTAILPAMMQGISNMVDFNMPVFEAVAAPRVSVTSDVIDISNRIPRYVQAELEKAGYPVSRSYMGFAFAALHAIQAGRTLSGGADPQRDGMWMRG